jgi:hypothetical protein
MAATLNRRAYEHAKELITEGRFIFDERDAWSEHRPSAEEENEFIRLHSFAEYGEWYLGLNDEKPEAVASPTRAAAPGSAFQHRRSNDVLWRRRERIHRLSFAGAGPRRATESLRRSALEVIRAKPGLDNLALRARQETDDLSFGPTISSNWPHSTPAPDALRETFPAQKSATRHLVRQYPEVTA